MGLLLNVHDCLAFEFWFWAAANSCCHIKKKNGHTSAIVEKIALVLYIPSWLLISI